jgi:acyl carrier protein
MDVAKQGRYEAIRDIVVEVLEIDAGELTESSLFREDHEADSLRAIEIMSRLEKEFDIEIPQNELAKMTNLHNVYEVVRGCADWGD